jgi:hypothetical protein
MIIYNKAWLANQRLQDELEKDLKHGRITGAEFAVIKEKYPVGFYTPNVFVRVGLFILTCVIVSFTDGLLSLMASSSNVVTSFGWFFFLGALAYLVLEIIVNTKFHYRAGVDDALLIISGCLFLTGFYIIIHNSNNGAADHVIFSGIVLVVSLFLSLRFTDILAGMVCCASFFAIIFFSWTRIFSSGLTTVPFVMMFASALVYALAYTYGKKARYINYQNCFTIVQVIALLTLYAAGNYHIIQTLGNEMKSVVSDTNTPVPFGLFFWAWTILIPLVYLGFGIKRKDAILLRTGLVLIAAGVFTVRNYYHLLPVDMMLTITGAMLLSIVYAIMKYLETPKHGFTREATGDAHAMDHLKIESLIVAETFSHTQSPPADDGAKFGGGDFGGGGSSAGF